MRANTLIPTAKETPRIDAMPVFVDAGEDYFLIEPAAVEVALTERTGANFPEHMFGQTAPVEFHAPIAANHDLEIIGDAAQSQGALSSAERAGAFGLPHPIAKQSGLDRVNVSRGESQL